MALGFSGQVSEDRAECRRTFSSRPIAIQVDIMEVPPAETSGSGIPVIGMMPKVMPMFSKV